MSKPVVSVGCDASLESAYRVLSERGISCVPVVEPNGRAVGVLSRTDLLRLGRLSMGPLGRTQALSWPAATTAEAGHRGVVTVPATTSIAAAARTMVEQHIHRVFVADGGELVGVFSTREILLAITRVRLATPIGRHAARPSHTMHSPTELSRAMDRLRAAQVAGLVVVDDEEWPIGTFTQRDALLARDLPPDTPLEDAMSHAMLCLPARTPLHRAAAHASATRARRVLVTENHLAMGVLTGLDFARAVVDA